MDFALSAEQRELTEAAAGRTCPGGSGDLAVSNNFERDLRNAVASTIYSGTSEIQRVVLARMLGL